jgi:hypothetical protein
MSDTSGDGDKNRNICIGVCICLVIVGLAVGLGVGLTQGGGSSCKPAVKFNDVFPDVVFNGILNSIKLNVSNLNASAAVSVDLIERDTKMVINVTFTSSPSGDSLTVALPKSTPSGNYTVRVKNAKGCVGTQGNFRIVSEITLPAVFVAPQTLFTEVSNSLTISVAQPVFIPTPQLYLVPSNSTVDIAYPLDVTYIDNLTVTAQIPTGLSLGVYDIVVVNPDGNVGVLVGGLLITSCTRVVLVFYATPQYLYSGIPNRLYVYVTGINDTTAGGVWLIDTNGTAYNLTWNFASPNSFGRIAATVPASLPSGSYTVRVSSLLGCVANYGPINIVSTVDLIVSRINPAYVWTEVSTPVNVQLMNPGFLETPQVYLSSGNATAYVIQAVLYSNPSSIDITLPSGLAPGVYDVVIVNPDGRVAVASSGITVTVDQPPIVLAAQPSSLDRSGSGLVNLTGINLINVTYVSLTCDSPTGPITTNATALTSYGPTAVAADFNLAVYTVGTLCSIQLYFASGQTYRYSTISIRSSSGNIVLWNLLNPVTFNVPRRAPSLLTGAPLASTRVLYVVGGDNGTSLSDAPQQNNTIKSIEAATIDENGYVSNFTILLQTLPKPCVFGGSATIGSYLYVACGYDGENNTASAEIFRAQVLSPLLVPTVTAVDLLFDENQPSNLTQGLWYYTVTGVFNSTDLNNPGGESLPGAVITLQIPNITHLLVSLTWDDQPGAVSYNIYRTPVANSSSSNLRLVANVAANRYIDHGFDPISQQMPLRPYSLGNFAHLPTLNTARYGFGLAAVPTNANKTAYNLYVFGGTDSAGTLLRSYEFMQITINEPADPQSPQTHTTTGWTTGTALLSYARTYLSAVVAENLDSTAIAPGSYWIYIGGGKAAAGPDKRNDAALSQANGQLTFYANPAIDFQSAATGYCYGKANNFLFTVGGTAGAPSRGGSSGDYCTAAGGPCGTVPPDLRNPNAFGVNLVEARWFAPCVSSQVFIFVGGGADSPTGPSKTLERSFCCG